jgi:hypothetical protein
MTDPTESVLIANHKFYRALSLADASAMRAQWAKSAEATCAHPGWHVLTGYQSIQQSWAAVFVNQGPIRIWPSQEEVSVEGDMLWVACLENIDASNSSISQIISVRARNAFCQTERGWRILHHLAEALPGLKTQITNQRLATN